MTKSGVSDEKIRNRAKDGSQGVPAIQSALPCSKSVAQQRAYVYREWDEYRDNNDGQLADSVDKDGCPVIRNKTLKTITPVACSTIDKPAHLKEHE